MSLQSLYLMPTLDCNCRCSYCYIPEVERRKTSADPDFKPVLEEFINQSGDHPQLRFIGGEPLIRMGSMRELIRFFLHACPQGLVVVNSNGTLLESQMLEPLGDLSGQIAFIISLDGPEPLHNSRRRLLNGQNAFQKALHAIRLLQQRGFPVLCNMVLDRESAAAVPEFFPFLKEELQMDAVSVSLNSHPPHPFPTEEKLRLLIQAYRQGEKSGLTVSGHHRLLLGKQIPELSCTAGRKTILITPDQTAWPCQRFVGRIHSGRWLEAPSLAEAADSNPVADCCYTEETASIAEALHAFYRQEMPHYLQVNDLDRLLFGVI